MLSYRILDVLAVGFTSLAITLDGECLIWGRHDDEDIDKPGIMESTATPRDLLIKGYLVSTGGCVYLGEWLNASLKLLYAENMTLCKC